MLKALSDRIARTLGLFVDEYQKQIQPKAEHLGNAFGVANDTISLFTEEIIRGNIVFALGMILKRVMN